MYIKCFLFLKFFSFAIMLPMHDNNMNREVTSLDRSHMSTTYYDTISKRATEESSDDSRIDFQIRNHRGLGTYIFGFDTGSGKNRQFKMEERLQDGSVKGRYGFYDAKGQLKIISYIAGLINGYQERHHETITYKSEI
ncbi:uncharacterized protein LOC126856673 [Cataglyphis hispanica]|uniref:uncharacterized protein LOC126856673 n=1 Tax=Cataglyphis hispanica TaxID=1086592 RepID=UPI0021805375|nr:uncharacterized protein LOC126856673 [Cataglyphis hispanica]